MERDAIVRDGPPEQCDAFRKAIELCDAELGFDQEPPELNEEFAAKQYQRQVEARECLLAEGYSPPMLPSEAKYIDQLLVDGYVYSVFEQTNIDYEDPVHGTCPDPLDTWG